MGRLATVLMTRRRCLVEEAHIEYAYTLIGGGHDWRVEIECAAWAAVWAFTLFVCTSCQQMGLVQEVPAYFVFLMLSCGEEGRS